MMLGTASLLIDPASIESRIMRFLQTRLAESDQKGVVFGLSGGLDSSTIAALCAKAYRRDDTLALIMPHKESNPLDKEHALLVTKKFKIPYKIVDITSAVEAVKANYPELVQTGITDSDEELKTRIVIGNIKARTRMMNLYMIANSTSRLVIGSGDKSETLIGYYTKYGDGGADIFPIADLYKTQVRILARHLGVPKEIIAKPPSPGFWTEQTAEGEIGMKYEQLDLILYGLERFMTPKEIARQLKVPVETVVKVDKMVKSTEHKRRGGIVFKIGYRTPTLDWRIPL
jgi:NAD+ synthase